MASMTWYYYNHVCTWFVRKKMCFREPDFLIILLPPSLTFHPRKNSVNKGDDDSNRSDGGDGKNNNDNNNKTYLSFISYSISSLTIEERLRGGGERGGERRKQFFFQYSFYHVSSHQLFPSVTYFILPNDWYTWYMYISHLLLLLESYHSVLRCLKFILYLFTNYWGTCAYFNEDIISKKKKKNDIDVKGDRAELGE